jgi:hypothetical protein
VEHSEAGVEMAACYEAEAATCSRIGIEDSRWWQHRRQVAAATAGRCLGREHLGGNEKLLSVARESARPEILDHGPNVRHRPWYERLPFPSMGDICTRAASLISLQRATHLE